MAEEDESREPGKSIITGLILSFCVSQGVSSKTRIDTERRFRRYT